MERGVVAIKYRRKHPSRPADGRAPRNVQLRRLQEQCVKDRAAGTAPRSKRKTYRQRRRQRMATPEVKHSKISDELTASPDRRLKGVQDLDAGSKAKRVLVGQ